MAAASRLGRQLEEVNLLTDSEKAEDIDRELIAIGYRCLHRSPDAGNYLRGDERVDFIYASRPAARGLLSNATTVQTAFGEVRVVSTEGLIGLKLQGFVNNPRRTQDLEDIKALKVSVATDSGQPFAADGGITSSAIFRTPGFGQAGFRRR